MILCRHSFRSQPGPGGFLKFQIRYGLRCHREKPYPVQRISTTFGLSFFPDTTQCLSFSFKSFCRCYRPQKKAHRHAWENNPKKSFSLVLTPLLNIALLRSINCLKVAPDDLESQSPGKALHLSRSKDLWKVWILTSLKKKKVQIKILFYIVVVPSLTFKVYALTLQPILWLWTFCFDRSLSSQKRCYVI